MAIPDFGNTLTDEQKGALQTMENNGASPEDIYKAGSGLAAANATPKQQPDAVVPEQPSALGQVISGAIWNDADKGVTPPTTARPAETQLQQPAATGPTQPLVDQAPVTPAGQIQPGTPQPDIAQQVSGVPSDQWTSRMVGGNSGAARKKATGELAGEINRQITEAPKVLEQQLKRANDSEQRQIEQLQATTDYKNQLATEQAKQTQLIQDHDAKVNQWASTQLATLNDAVDKMSKMQVDPEHYMHSRSTGDKILAGVAAFLGGMGGGQNQVLAMINKNIDRDIDAQVQNINTKKDALNQKRSLFNDTYKIYGDQRVAMLATKQMMYQDAMNKLDAMAEQSKIGAVQDRQAELRDGLKEKADQNSLQLHKALVDILPKASRGQQMVTVQTAHGPIEVPAATALQYSLSEDENAARRAAANGGRISSAAMASSIPGLVAKNPDVADEWLNKNRTVASNLSRKIGGVTKVVDAAQKYKELRAKHNGYISETTDPEDYQLALNYRQTIMAGLRDANDEGASDKVDAKYEKLVPEPDETAFRTMVGGNDPAQGRLNAIVKDAILAGNGALRGVPGMSYDPTAVIPRPVKDRLAE